MKYKTTKEIKFPKKLINQVIGQDEAVEIIKKAAKQRRNVLLIGEPGTGKSMVGQAMAELLPKENLVDTLAFPNPKDEDKPLIKNLPAGHGNKLVTNAKMRSMTSTQDRGWLFLILLIVGLSVFSFVADWLISMETSEILMAADRIISAMMTFMIMIIASVFYLSYKLRTGRVTILAPKVIVDNSNKTIVPFIDATGLHAGALLGDIKHDPFQTGGLGTPAHERVSAGAIHKAHKGILFIDEIGTLRPEMQVELLTAMQEGKFSITGRSERSAGAMVQTEPVPCDFVFIGAGNAGTLRQMHPALRSRLRGYGYDVYMRSNMDDTKENREKISIFVAQEVSKDKKIPHFSKEAVEGIIKMSKKISGRKGYLTLKMRELGGVVRAAGDLAREAKSKVVEAKHVKLAEQVSSSLEQQMAERYIKEKKEYQVIRTKGSAVGRVNGLAVIENSNSGLILPIEAAMTPSMNSKQGKMIATGKLGKIAKEAIQNVSAIIKKYSGKDILNYDLHIQFIQTYEGVEGDSASISVATAVISALENIPIRQEVAMTGSLSIRGEVLPVGGVNAKVEAAIGAGIKKVIVPAMNKDDVFVKGVEIVSVSNIAEVIEHSLDWKGKNKQILKKMKKVLA